MDALKDLLGGIIQEMTEAEMDDHLGYSKSERSDSDDDRNGYKTKQVNSSYGSMEIEVPQDNRPLSEVYPVLYIDAIHYSGRDNGVIRKLAAYVILGINNDGYKEVIYKIRAGSSAASFQSDHYHRRSTFADFCSHTLLFVCF